MTTTDASPALRCFVNGRGVDVPSGATALDALRHAEPDEAAAVASGQRAISDSRGLPVEPSTAAYAGAIYRTVRGAR